MKMYYFFTADRDGDPTWGQEYFVMSPSLEEAREAVLKSPKWEYSDMNRMKVTEHDVNEVVQTELS